MRNMLYAVLVGAIVTAWSPFASATEEKDLVLGQWYSEGTVSVLYLYKKGEKLFGKIVWLAEPNYPEGDEEAGMPRRDRNNPKKRKRNKPEIGLDILRGFKFNEKDQAWKGGTIYDPAKGKKYKCIISFDENAQEEGFTKLGVRGYIGIPAMGRTTIWTRVPEDELIKTER